LASRRMARARWGTRRVLLTRASLFAGDAAFVAPEAQDGTHRSGSNLHRERLRQMSAKGQKQTGAMHEPMSALPLRADMCGATADVCYGPIADMQSAADTN
jgi:hypothetical protein